MDSSGLSRDSCGHAARMASTLALIAFSVVVLNTLFSYLRLRHIPGPYFAALTNLVRQQWVVMGNTHDIHTGLHRRYGTVVRFGPNAVMESRRFMVSSRGWRRYACLCCCCVCLAAERPRTRRLNHSPSSTTPSCPELRGANSRMFLLLETRVLTGK